MWSEMSFILWNERKFHCLITLIRVRRSSFTVSFSINLPPDLFLLLLILFYAFCRCFHPCTNKPGIYAKRCCCSRRCCCFRLRISERGQIPGKHFCERINRKITKTNDVQHHHQQQEEQQNNSNNENVKRRGKTKQKTKEKEEKKEKKWCIDFGLCKPWTGVNEIRVRMRLETHSVGFFCFNKTCITFSHEIFHVSFYLICVYICIPFFLRMVRWSSS